MKDHALSIFEAALKSVDPHRALHSHVRLDGSTLEIDSVDGAKKVRLPVGGNIYVVGAGKGTAPMAQALEEILGDRLTAGIICVKDAHTLPLKKIEVLEASHPVPDERGVEAGRRIFELVSRATENDLVIGALSGGGSALLTLPVEGVSLHDIQTLTDQLLACGAEIGEINSLRKHLSMVKGGKLAKAAWPARVVNLALSDVVGDRLDVIASGPFSADPSTFADALDVIRNYGIMSTIPQAVASTLEEGSAGNLADTPKPGEEAVDSVIHAIIGSNRKCLDAAAQRARELGYQPMILTSVLEGDAQNAARFLGAIATEVMDRGDPVGPPACLLAGGETTVNVTGTGLGGRNQHLALALSVYLDGAGDFVALSGGTDGTDGPTDAAGGLVDGHTIERGRELGLDGKKYLAACDSYHFLDIVDGLIKTGPTRTNVMDIQLVLMA